jgi:hypothetical protein
MQKVTLREMKSRQTVCFPDTGNADISGYWDIPAGKYTLVQETPSNVTIEVVKGSMTRTATIAKFPQGKTYSFEEFPPVVK